MSDPAVAGSSKRRWWLELPLVYAGRHHIISHLLKSMAHNGGGQRDCERLVRYLRRVHIGGGLSARCALDGVYTELAAQAVHHPPPATCDLVLNAGEPSFYFYVSNSCPKDSNAPAVYFEVKVSLYERSSLQLSGALSFYTSLTATIAHYR